MSSVMTVSPSSWKAKNIVLLATPNVIPEISDRFTSIVKAMTEVIAFSKCVIHRKRFALLSYLAFLQLQACSFVSSARKTDSGW
mmetsp:Transcript_6606/g.20781  ORF Transcript_6606/g.20781 Transcript_6606/m.20781 type:complete len:84 (-) Transcript_6606:171-422(-)